VHAWRLVDAGPFRCGESGVERELVIEYEYWFSQYLVTNAHFYRFVVDGGYSDDRWAHIWTDAGRLWRVGRNGPQFYSEVLRLPNHPQIGITWYEAVAYCRWLTERMKATGVLSESMEIRLPTEKEWEKAARGTDGRCYPFGSYFDDARANVRLMQATTAVGIYPDGASPYGILDMVGNCWKWCITKWNPSSNSIPDNRLEGTEWRCYRGDSWGADKWRDFPMNWRTHPWSPHELHCGNRFGIAPEDDRPDAVGFHIVLAATGSLSST
jgi:formylglycine-generating enzyme required for sulfatase activity